MPSGTEMLPLIVGQLGKSEAKAEPVAEDDPDVIVVELNDADTGSPTFDAPYAPDGAVLRFVVAANDGTNTTYDDVRVVVAPNQGPQIQVLGDNTATAGDFTMIAANASDAEGDDLDE